LVENRAERQILRGTREGGKTYSFDDEHDKRKPAQRWFQSSHEGDIFFLVFYSQACRWSKCLGCNLPSKCSQFHIDYEALMAQVDHAFSDEELLARSDSVRKVILSNNGSMLDEATFSSTALMYLLARMNMHLPHVTILTFESRPEYVDIAELEMMSRTLKEGGTETQLEIAIGLEAYDERIRNEAFRKGLDLDVLERLAADLAPYKFRLKCYVMQKPVPGMSDAEAVEDVRQAIDYLGKVASRHGVEINVHVNPTYVSSGTPLAESFERGEYVPPRLMDVAQAAKHARDKDVSVFLGLYDEGLAVEGGSFMRPGDEGLVARLEEFNRTQDFNILDRL